MKYTKNIHNKLLLNKFEFKYFEEQKMDGEVYNYTVYRKGNIEVTVSDSDKKVTVELVSDFKELKNISFEKLLKLDEIINN